MATNPKNRFCHLDSGFVYTAYFVQRKEENYRWTLMHRIFVHGKRATISSTNVATHSQPKLASWLRCLLLHLKWDPSENGLLCCRLAPTTQATGPLWKSESCGEQLPISQSKACMTSTCPWNSSDQHEPLKGEGWVDTANVGSSLRILPYRESASKCVNKHAC